VSSWLRRRHNDANDVGCGERARHPRARCAVDAGADAAMGTDVGPADGLSPIREPEDGDWRSPGRAEAPSAALPAAQTAGRLRRAFSAERPDGAGADDCRDAAAVGRRYRDAAAADRSVHGATDERGMAGAPGIRAAGAERPGRARLTSTGECT